MNSVQHDTNESTPTSKRHPKPTSDTISYRAARAAGVADTLAAKALQDDHEYAYTGFELLRDELNAIADIAEKPIPYADTGKPEESITLPLSGSGPADELHAIEEQLDLLTAAIGALTETQIEDYERKAFHNGLFIAKRGIRAVRGAL